MKFDFENAEEVVQKTRNLKDRLSDGPCQDYRFKAYIESTDSSVLSALAKAECRLTVLQENEDGRREEISLDLLPLQFDIQLRRTSQIMSTFQSASNYLKEFNWRARLSAKGVGSDPVQAYRRLRNNKIVLHLEVERREDGEFEPLMWGTGMEVFTESVGTVDRPWETDVVNKSIQARVLGRWNEFEKTSGGSIV